MSVDVCFIKNKDETSERDRLWRLKDLSWGCPQYLLNMTWGAVLGMPPVAFECDLRLCLEDVLRNFWMWQDELCWGCPLHLLNLTWGAVLRMSSVSSECDLRSCLMAVHCIFWMWLEELSWGCTQYLQMWLEELSCGCPLYLLNMTRGAVLGMSSISSKCDLRSCLGAFLRIFWMWLGELP